MALTQCKECKKEISSEAKVCPHCGIDRPGMAEGTPEAVKAKINLTKCKACKKEVAHNAKVCPHCGVKDPGVTVGTMLAGAAFLGVVVAIAMAFCGKSEPETDKTTRSDQVTQVVQIKTLGMTLEQFRSTFNGLIKPINAKYVLPVLDIQEGAVKNGFKHELADGLGILGNIDKKSGLILEVAAIFAGGNKANPLMTLSVFLAMAQAVNGETAKEENSKIVAEMIGQASEGFDDATSVKRQVGKLEYFMIASEYTGLVFTISAKE